MRLTGTESDLKVFLELIHKMQNHHLLEVLEESSPYKNRGESKLYRVYLKVDLERPE
jgi:GTPase SAR1 family protein